MKIEYKSLTGALVVAVTFMLVHGTIVAAGQEDKPESPPMHQGAISITGEGLSEKMTVLGGQLGRETVNGLDVGLFVLQAESPDRLEPGATGPTHVFNVTFLEQGKSGFVKDVRGAIVIEGPGEPRRVDFRPYESYHQATTRLEQEGDYRISIEFATEGDKGRTAAFPFRYRIKKHTGHRH